MLLEGGQQVAQAAGVARVAQNGNDAGDAATPSGTCEAAQAVLADESCAAPDFLRKPVLFVLGKVVEI